MTFRDKIDFMGPDFLLENEAARRLYHDHAAQMPICDYHSHLSPQEIADNRRFDNLTELWLHGDHYKWRAMRFAGIDERRITGDADARERFQAWAETVPDCLGNPLYHWTHLELRFPLGIENTLLSPATAEEIWTLSRQRLATPELHAQGILDRFQVRTVCTTDDPCDALDAHRRHAENGSRLALLPTFRPDAVLKIEQEGYADYLAELEAASGVAIRRYDDLLAALHQRLDYFAAHGCCLSDHSLEKPAFVAPPSSAELDRILDRRRSGESLSEEEYTGFTTALLLWLGRQYAERGWVMQLHLGAARSVSRRGLAEIGPNSGFDAIGDVVYGEPLAMILDALDQQRALPRTVLYNLNPRDNEMLASLVGSFQGDGIPGKIQFGAAWWFNDQRDGIERQLTTQMQFGLLRHFVGMLTDSRSLLSFSRHDYFRRIFCNMLGQQMARGELPSDIDRIGQLVRAVCYDNVQRYLFER
ncbi:glucuronate isomerase [Halomonas sp. McH1-25]|uniref:glucuronate isomerase n=1 Tax=unclassified Halomonas TaxID=2609666 RepID=UPI001EF55876|nr:MULTISPECIES: glucuronate isomerase [unclassified Halomonas]MCG7599176.1 glucuronate isomerase [Halomonas sp. McH1-25]MCP1344319.1 glucuronate isomerase [Halomonas sp. FL8]MCP1363173.1 glucuronate isomerase [Halomonas sp. BBD45]